MDLPATVAVCLQILASVGQKELLELGSKEGVEPRMELQPFLALAFVRLVQCVSVEMLHTFALLTFPCSPLRLWLPKAVQLLGACQHTAEKRVRVACMHAYAAFALNCVFVAIDKC